MLSAPEQSTFERLVARPEFGYVVVAYRPHRTTKGKMVWKRHHNKTGILTSDELRTMGITKVHRSLQWTPLTENERLALIAFPTLPAGEEYMGEGLA